MRLKRTPDDGANCDWDNEPEDGFSCQPPPPTLKVCGPCGILSQGVIPLGATYLNAGSSTGLVYATSVADNDDAILVGDNDDDSENNEDLYFYLMITFAVLFGVAAGTIVMMKINANRYRDMKGSSLTNPLHS